MYELYISYIKRQPWAQPLELVAPGIDVDVEMTETARRQVARGPMRCHSVAADMNGCREQALLPLAAELVEDQVARVALLLGGREAHSASSDGRHDGQLVAFLQRGAETLRVAHVLVVLEEVDVSAQ